ncbi:MAG: ATP-binding protein [Planctomycetota bacterium]
MASLFVIRGHDQGKQFPIEPGVTRLGRDGSNQIQLLDTEASRRHAEIRCRESDREVTLVDLGSSNGTHVNGDAVTQATLGMGDRIEIGRTLMVLTDSSSSLDLHAAHGVDIVRQVDGAEPSRIVASLSQEHFHLKRGLDSLRDDPAPAGDSARVVAEDGSSRLVTSVESVSEARSEYRPQLQDQVKPIDADRSLEVMYRTAIAVGRAADLNEVLERILHLVFEWVEADRGCIMLRDPESNRLTPATRRDRPSKSPMDASGRMAISQTILDYVLKQAEGVRTTDALDDSRFENAASIVQGGVREAICVPLQGRYEIVGAMYVDTYTSPGELVRRGTAHRFHDEHLRLITAIGHQAALAIEDTNYYSALLQSERLAAMGQTIATLSHHVKNILQGISGGSYLIEAGLKKDDTDTIRKGWSIVDRNQERISNLVMDMLTFSKERQPERVDADWNEVIHDVCQLMQGRAGESSIELRFEPEEETPLACFDTEAIHRGVLNLVTNAIDAAAAHVLVTTGFDSAAGWWVVVADDGAGIDDGDRERIFSLFESTKGARGTGLGLPVTAKIAREHGGSILVEDGPLGGAAFRLLLPPVATDMDALPSRNTSLG